MRYLVIILYFITTTTYGQIGYLYTSGPSALDGESLKLFIDGTYRYKTQGCMFSACIQGKYLNLGSLIVLTSYVPAPSDTANNISYDDFTEEDFLRVKYWLLNDGYITGFGCSYCVALRPVSYYQFVRMYY